MNPNLITRAYNYVAAMRRCRYEMLTLTFFTLFTPPRMHGMAWAGVREESQNFPEPQKYQKI